MQVSGSDKIMEVVSRVLYEGDGSTSHKEQVFNEIYSIVSDIFSSSLERSIYPSSPYLLAEIERELSEAEVLLVCPELIGSTVIGIVGQSRAVYQHLMSQVLEETDKSAGIVWNTNIPMIITGEYRNQDRNKIVGINHSDVSLELNVEEYRVLVQELYKKNIDVRRIMKSFLVSKKLKTKNITYVLFPEYVQNDHEYMDSIIPYLNKMVLHATDQYRWIPLYQKYTEKTPVDIVCSKDYMETVKKQLQAIEVSMYPEQDFEGYCLPNNKISYNFNFADKIYEKLLDVDRYYHRYIRKRKEQIEKLTEKSVKISQADIKEQIQILRKRIFDERENVAKTYANYLKAKEAVMKSAINLEKVLYQLGKLDEKGSFEDTSKAQETMVRVFFLLLDSGEYTTAKEYIRRLTDMGYENSLVLECYIDKMKGTAILESKIKKLRGVSFERWEIAKAFVYLSKELELKDEEIYKAAAYIEHPTTGKEYFYLGKGSEKQDPKQAVQYYKKSLELDYEDAGMELIKLAAKQPDLPISMHELGDHLVAEANYAVGMNSLPHKKGIVYLKMAASQKHMGAIEEVAHMLFEKCKRISWQRVGEKENQDSIYNVIGLYQYLIQHKKNSKDYQEKIGFMYCKLQDWSRALEYLKNCNTPEAQYECGKMYKYGNGTAQDLEKAKNCFQLAMEANYKDAKVQYDKIQNMQSDRSNSSGSYSETRSYSSSSSSSSSSSGYCFITTAACIALGSDKDCEELNVLRRFRDSKIDDHGGEGRGLIEEYYRIGPKIVENIDCSWNPMAVYKELWEDYIYPSYDFINRQEWDQAKCTYIQMVKDLCQLFHIPVKEKIMEKYDIVI